MSRAILVSLLDSVHHNPWTARACIESSRGLSQSQKNLRAKIARVVKATSRLALQLTDEGHEPVTLAYEPLGPWHK